MSSKNDEVHRWITVESMLSQTINKSAMFGEILSYVVGKSNIHGVRDF